MRLCTRDQACIALSDGCAFFGSQDGRTPLSHAAEKGHLDVVTLLVEAGADLNAVDKVTW